LVTVLQLVALENLTAVRQPSADGREMHS